MRLVLVGGHLAPALAILDVLPKDCEVSFIGRKYAFEGDQAVSLEYSTVTKRGVRFYELTSGRLQRVITVYTIFSLLKIPFGMLQSFVLLSRIKPEAVLSFGGYLSVPVCFSAFFLRIPIVIHEQTFEAGLANRIIAAIASKVCISWETSRLFFPPSKTVLTGNPMRTFPTSSQKWKGDIPLIYITGGSSGSQRLNGLVEGCIADLVKHYRVLHQTGDAKDSDDYDRLSHLAASLPDIYKKRYILRKFIDPTEAGAVMNEAVLVVSRSGINTVTELMYFGKPCLLIPLTHSQNNEQVKNARFLDKIGIAIVLFEESLTPQDLLVKIDAMMDALQKYIDKARQAKKMINLDAADRIVKETYAVAKKKE